MANDRVIVRLKKHFRQNNPGEVCGFDRETAEYLLSKRDEKGQPVAELVKDPDRKELFPGGGGGKK